MIQHVQLPVYIFPKAGDEEAGVADLVCLEGAVWVLEDTPEGTGAVVGEEVVAGEGGVGLAAIDVAAGDGAVAAAGVVVFKDGGGVVGLEGAAV